MDSRSDASRDELPPNCGVIELRLREIAQLFDSLDPSPFHEKDLDRNAEEYIASSARELSSKGPLALVIHLGEPLKPGEVEGLRTAVRVHFERRALLSRRALRQLLRRGWISLGIGLMVLAAGILAGSLAATRLEEPIASLVRESLLIGGWVAMWGPMEIFLYDWWPLRNERRVYDRLSRVVVKVVPSTPGSR